MSTALLSTDIDTIEGQLSAARQAIADRTAVANVVLTACGGSYAVMLPGQYFLDTRAGALEAHAINAAEFTARSSRLVGEQSVVVLCSHSGTTPETVAAAEHARTAGALTISFTNDPASPLAQASELVIDAREFGLEVVDESLRGIVAHLVFNVVLRAYADALADHRGHPLSVRRYMWRMEY